MLAQDVPKVEIHDFVLVMDSLSSSFDYQSHLLPEDFNIFTNGKGIFYHPYPGMQVKILPVFNEYVGRDGGYVAIYSREKNKAIYEIGSSGIYVIGLLRVQGHYETEVFVPQGYQLGDNITQDSHILTLCEKYFPDLQGKIWIGGNTGEILFENIGFK